MYMLFLWSGMRWKRDLLNNLLSLTFLYYKWEMIVEIAIYSPKCNMWAGFANFLSFISSFFTFITLCDFLKYVIFHNVPSLTVSQHRVFFFSMEMSCNWAISISKQLQTVFVWNWFHIEGILTCSALQCFLSPSCACGGTHLWHNPRSL